MSTYDALELRLDDSATVEYVRAPEDVAVETLLEQFVLREGDFLVGWILVQDAGEEPRYIRYESVASVTIARGLDDERVPFVSGF